MDTVVEVVNVENKVYLLKKERSSELNSMNRILVDFKSLVDEGNFVIYKSNGLIYYIFDLNGFFSITKSNKFLKIEKWLKEDEFVKIDYVDIKNIVGLKKSQVIDIFYDSDKFTFEIDVLEEINQYVIKKHKDSDNIMKNIVKMTLPDKLESIFTKVLYDVKNQVLVNQENANIMYPYKITFSDDINFKLKIDIPNSLYYARPLNNGAFVQVVTITDYKKIYKAKTMLFIFNYLNNRDV